MTHSFRILGCQCRQYVKSTHLKMRVSESGCRKLRQHFEKSVSGTCSHNEFTVTVRVSSLLRGCSCELPDNFLTRGGCALQLINSLTKKPQTNTNMISMNCCEEKSFNYFKMKSTLSLAESFLRWTSIRCKHSVTISSHLVFTKTERKLWESESSQSGVVSVVQ